jgi:hypothetical protein
LLSFCLLVGNLLRTLSMNDVSIYDAVLAGITSSNI